VCVCAGGIARRDLREGNLLGTTYGFNSQAYLVGNCLEGSHRSRIERIPTVAVHRQRADYAPWRVQWHQESRSRGGQQ
jgi:hypothetical protein